MCFCADYDWLQLYTLGGGHAHPCGLLIQSIRINWGGAGISRTGRVLGRDVILMLVRDMVTLGNVSAVGARVGSVLIVDGAGERLRHWLESWRTLSMAYSWVSQMVDGESLMAHVLFRSNG